MLKMARKFTKEDPFFEDWRQEITADEQALNKLIDDKQSEMTNHELSFNAQLRDVLTTALTTSTHPSRLNASVSRTRRVDSNDSDATQGPVTGPAPQDRPPGYDFAKLLLAKSADLIDNFKIAAEAVDRVETIDPIKSGFEKEKADVARLIIIGEEVAKRKIDAILQKPELAAESTPKKKKKKAKRGPKTETPRKGEIEALFEEAEIIETEAIFATLRKGVEDGMDDENEETLEKRPVAGFYPLLYDIERGAKRMVKNLPDEEKM
ncbi:hypothetical protein BDV97DRAFT_352214 [Delphinella strobiligena]|nr:hypothetical protein BDV97DRAFT_352214 [Delphinella strobiligena]